MHPVLTKIQALIGAGVTNRTIGEPSRSGDQTKILFVHHGDAALIKAILVEGGFEVISELMGGVQVRGVLDGQHILIHDARQPQHQQIGRLPDELVGVQVHRLGNDPRR